MDEARIQEIVDRVLARIGDVPESPMAAVNAQPDWNGRAARAAGGAAA